MRIFKLTPNDAPPGEIHEMALHQLTQWEAIAWEWETYNDVEYERCSVCHLAIYKRMDTELVEYGYSSDQILALTVAHLRNMHRDLERLVA